MNMRRSLAVWFIVVACPIICASQALTVRIPDNTVVPVRLAQVISSETSALGDVVHLNVAEDVIIDRALVIRRGTPATGTVIESSPYRTGSGWPWSRSRRGRLAFSIDATRAVDGHSIRLRAPYSTGRDGTPERAVIARQAPAALMQWAHEGARFEAYVNGEFLVQALPSP